MAKPIRVAELQARVQALLRRTYPALFQTELVCGPYRFIPLKQALLIHGQAAKLKHREYTLAIFLFRNIGRLLSREHLLEAVWGADATVTSRSLDTHMSRLRSKRDLRPANGLVLSAVYGFGFRLEFIDQDGIESPYPMAGASE